MAQNSTEILNMALSYLGKMPVDDLQGNDPLVRWFRENYGIVRDSVIMDSEYAFATQRMLIDAEHEHHVKPEFEYEYAFALERLNG